MFKSPHVLAVAAGLTVITAAAPLAKTDVLHVPRHFATIQAAVDAAGPGDIIQVAAGTYCESVVITKSDLRLRATPSGRVILSGDCTPGPYGIKVAGTAALKVGAVEIMGFVVDGFETGILLEHVTRSRVHLNEARRNVFRPGTTLPYSHYAQGILLVSSDYNEVAQNVARDNGHLGIGLFSSSWNVVRGNRLYDNQADYGMLEACSLMLWGTPGSTNNQVVENELVGEKGAGLMVGSGPATANIVAQNRVHRHANAGIWVTGSASGNIVQQNDARGNARLAGYDLWEGTRGSNTWNRNLGTCAPESGICGQ
jgi:parallel beta-helix repeat protein